MAVIVDLYKNFKKQLAKMPKKYQEQFSKKLDIFFENPSNPVLNNHQLNGELKNLRSINISGDIRAIYEQINKNTVLFLSIASHSKLYD